MFVSPKTRKRIEADDEIDFFLATEAGQARVRSYYYDKCHESSMISLFESAVHLPGDVIECGVFRGDSMKQLGLRMTDLSKGKKLYGLDSFGGFPKNRVGRNDVGLFRILAIIRRKFRDCDDAPMRLKRFFECYNIQAETIPGYFEDSLPLFAKHRFCFAHLDCDIYSSYKTCLEYLYDRMVPGGVIVFDDYRSPKWPGAALAIDEFFADRDESIESCTDRKTPSWFIRKQVKQYAIAA
jgi:O-methyltransferase